VTRLRKISEGGESTLKRSRQASFVINLAEGDQGERPEKTEAGGLIGTGVRMHRSA